MFLKNYTSDVPVSKTLYRIEQVLIRCGVNGISKEYAGVNGEVTAVSFKIKLPNTPEMTVRLPADKEKALDALWLDYAGDAKLSPDGKSIVDWESKKRRKRSDFAAQAERTAWRIVQDWIEVQMSMIQMRQATYVQVFWPYIWDGETTVYQRLQSSGFRALLPEKSEAST